MVVTTLCLLTGSQPAKEQAINNSKHATSIFVIIMLTNSLAVQSGYFFTFSCTVPFTSPFFSPVSAPLSFSFNWPNPYTDIFSAPY